MAKVIEILKKVGAVLTDDHFVYTSGRHGSIYLNKDALYPHTEATSEVGKLLAQKVSDLEIEVVVAPALGGIILSQWTAFHLTKLKKREVLGVYTEKTPDKQQIFTRGYDAIVKHKNVFVLEDLTTTGQSVKKVIASVKRAGGKVITVGVMVNRNPQEVTALTLGAPFFALDSLQITTFSDLDCPLCRHGVPINQKIGHGKKFVQAKNANS